MTALLQTAIKQACVIILPVIGRDLNIPNAKLQWVISSTNLAYACTLFLWGRLADLCGRRFIFQLGITLVTLSCLVTPFAPEEISFDIFRAIQGIGGAAATPSAVGIIFAVFPPGKPQIYAMSAFSAGFPLGNVMGSVLGGIIAQFLSWKWTFWIMSIISATSGGMALFVVPVLAQDVKVQMLPIKERLKALGSEMDWLGLLVSTTFLMFLLVSLTEGNVAGWTSPWVLTLLVGACVLLPVFILWELRLEKRGARPPLIKLSVFKSRIYSAAQVIDFLFWAAFNNFLVFATYFYQDYQGLNALDTTLRFLPSGITGLVTVFISSQIVSRVDGYLVALWSTACVSVACLLFAVPIPPETTYWAYGFPAMVIATIGADTLSPCLSLFVMRSIPKEDQAMGAAIFQSMAQVGRSVGLALATTIQISVTDSGAVGISKKEELLQGYRAANWFNGAIGIVSFAVVAYWFKGAGKIGAKQ